MYENAYDRVQAVLDDALGADEGCGAGEGIATDVLLVVRQRDLARTLLAETIDLLFEHYPAAADRIKRQSERCTPDDLCP